MFEPFTCVGDLEFAATPARYITCITWHSAVRHQLCHEPLAEIWRSSYAIGVAERQNQPDHHPERRGLKRSADDIAKRRDRAADEHEQRDLVGGSRSQPSSPAMVPCSWRSVSASSRSRQKTNTFYCLCWCTTTYY